MNRHAPSVNERLRSVGRPVRAAFGALVALATPELLAGCIIVTEDTEPDVIYVESPPPAAPPAETPSDTPVLSTIDTDYLLSAEPGDGVGVFVEYAAGGNWSIRTTCDANTSGYACTFDVNAIVVDETATIDSIDRPELEGADYVEPIDNYGLHFHAETDVDTDRVTFHTAPGAIVQFDVVLDGKDGGRFFYWFGDGVLHQGAPTNPIQLEPSQP